MTSLIGDGTIRRIAIPGNNEIPGCAPPPASRDEDFCRPRERSPDVRRPLRLCRLQSVIIPVSEDAGIASSNPCTEPLESFDLVVVGAGFYGATIAERAATEGRLRVIVIDRRPHLAGNAYSAARSRHRHRGASLRTALLPHRQRGRLEIPQSVSRRLRASSYASGPRHRGQIFPLPINLATICQFFGRSMSPEEARALILEQTAGIADGPQQPRGQGDRLDRPAAL